MNARSVKVMPASALAASVLWCLACASPAGAGRAAAAEASRPAGRGLRIPPMTIDSEPARTLTGSPESFLTSCREEMAHARAEVARLEAMPAPVERIAALEAYDGAMAALSEAGARASLCRNVHPDERMREAAEVAEQEVDALATEFSLDRKLYDTLAAIAPAGADPATSYLLRKSLRDFRRAGVDRDEPTRQRVRALREELVRIGQEFGKNIKDDVRRLELDPADLDGLPEDWRRSHPSGPDGKVVVTTDNTDYVPFITYARSARAREALWRLYRLRGHPKNLEVLTRMLARRAEVAKLLGYASWAAYVTEDKMIGSDVNAAAFIERIAQASKSRMDRDYGQLLARKRKEDPGAVQVDGWDSAYLQERVKAEEYDFDSQSVRPYFEYGKVKDGLLALTGRLFGIRYRRVEMKTWSSDVEVYEVLEGDRPLGLIYLDMHPRDGKYKHYAQFTLSTGQAGRRLPEGVLVCNFPRPGKEPALMEHSDVKTFFHEFGHLLHHVLGGHTRWASQSGVATEWDFVEAPSQMLEEWVWDPVVLAGFARHVKTGEPIPEALVRRMRAADEYGKGLFVRQQMFYAALSLELHRYPDPAALDTTRLVTELQRTYTPFRHVEGTYFQESFGHLDGYSAIYYTYMWSLVIAKDLFSVFQKEGLLSPGVAQRYRKAVLEPGGTRPAAELVETFLGRPYSFDADQAWLDFGG
jgi:thimet oligopeptidase